MKQADQRTLIGLFLERAKPNPTEMAEFLRQLVEYTTDLNRNVTATIYDQWAQAAQVLISRIGTTIDHLNDGQIGKAREELIHAEAAVEDCAKRLRGVTLAEEKKM